MHGHYLDIAPGISSYEFFNKLFMYKLVHGDRVIPTMTVYPYGKLHDQKLGVSIDSDVFVKLDDDFIQQVKDGL